MILCLLKGYPGVTQISKVSAEDGINGRDKMLIKFQMSPDHPMVGLYKAYRKF